MIRRVTIKKFAELSGYSEDAIRTKIRDGVWLEGDVWYKPSDNRVLIDIEGYERWVEMGYSRALGRPKAAQSRSPSSIKANGARKGSNSSPRPLI